MALHHARPAGRRRPTGISLGSCLVTAFPEWVMAELRRSGMAAAAAGGHWLAALDRSAEQPLQQLVPVYFQMGCDVAENRGERADLEGAMRRNRYVMYGGW